MAKKLIVHCRICGADIDRDAQDDWLEAQPKWFYHISCYEDFAKKKGKILEKDIAIEVEDDLWKDATYTYLQKDLKMPLNYVKFDKQWGSYLKKGMTAKGIYFSLRYFYEIAHGDPRKSENGIGIVPHIYKEGTEYWGERNQRDKGICARIEEQILASTHAETKVVIQRRKKGLRKPTVDLSIIANMPDEEDSK